MNATKTLYAPLKPNKTFPETWAADMCDWLNGLGPDDAPFGTQSPAQGKSAVTNGEVRRNWTGGSYAPHFKVVSK